VKVENSAFAETRPFVGLSVAEFVGSARLLGETPKRYVGLANRIDLSLY
jgi:hypothetical protein